MHICADSSESLSHVVMKKCPSPQFFNRTGSQTLIAGRKSRERERERERVCMGLHTNLLFWLVFLESRNTMFGSTNQSCYNCFRWGPMRGSRKFCQRGSNSATLTTFFSFLFLSPDPKRIGGYSDQPGVRPSVRLSVCPSVCPSVDKSLCAQ